MNLANRYQKKSPSKTPWSLSFSSYQTLEEQALLSESYRSGQKRRLDTWLQFFAALAPCAARVGRGHSITASPDKGSVTASPEKAQGRAGGSQLRRHLLLTWPQKLLCFTCCSSLAWALMWDSSSCWKPELKTSSKTKSSFRVPGGEEPSPTSIGKQSSAKSSLRRQEELSTQHKLEKVPGVDFSSWEMPKSSPWGCICCSWNHLCQVPERLCLGTRC